MHTISITNLCARFVFAQNMIKTNRKFTCRYKNHANYRANFAICPILCDWSKHNLKVDFFFWKIISIQMWFDMKMIGCESYFEVILYIIPRRGWGDRGRERGGWWRRCCVRGAFHLLFGLEGVINAQILFQNIWKKPAEDVRLVQSGEKHWPTVTRQQYCQQHVANLFDSIFSCDRNNACNSRCYVRTVTCWIRITFFFFWTIEIASVCCRRWSE